MRSLRRVYLLNLRFARRQLRRAREISSREPGREFTRSSYLEIYTVLRYVYLLLPVAYLPFAAWDILTIGDKEGIPYLVIFDVCFYVVMVLINFAFQPDALHRGSLQRLKWVCRTGVGLLTFLGTAATIILLREAEDLSIFSSTLLGVAVVFRFPDRTRFWLYGANYAALYSAYFAYAITDPVLIQNPFFILFLILIFDRLSHFTHVNNYLKRRRIVELNRLLVQQDQDKGDMMSIAVHDLKSPVSGIMGVVKLMREHPAGLPEYEQDEILADIEESTEKILANINDLVNIAGSPIGAVKPRYEIFDVNAMLYASLQNYHHLASLKDVKIYTYFQKPAQRVFSDRDMAARVVDNLLSNAVKYSPRGGNIFIRSRRVENQRNLVDIVIQDEGAGFTEEDRLRIFGRLVRLSARPTAGETSTGLGLFTVHRMIQVLEGADIGLESHPGQGTSFIVTLPRAPERGRVGPKTLARHRGYRRPAK